MQYFSTQPQPKYKTVNPCLISITATTQEEPLSALQQESRMVHSEPCLDDLTDEMGSFFCFGITSGSAFYMLKGMYNSPKGERLIRGSQALRMNVPRFASNCAIWGGLCSVFESSMMHVRQKDDPWNSILSAAAASGFLKMRQGLGPASRSALFVGAAAALFEGWMIMDNKATSNVCIRSRREEQ